MTIIVQTTDIVAAGDAVDAAGGSPQIINGQQFILTAGTNVVSTGAIGFSAVAAGIVDYSFVIHGSVFADGSGIRFFDTVAASDIHWTVNISETGVISSYDDVAVFMAAEDNATGVIDFFNAGTVSSTKDGAVILDGPERIDLTNTGTISSSELTPIFASAVRIFAADTGTLHNSGLIENVASTTLQAEFQHVAAVVVVGLTSGDDYTIVNSGAIRGGSHSIYNTSDQFTLQNTGDLIGHVVLANGGAGPPATS